MESIAYFAIESEEQKSVQSASKVVMYVGYSGEKASGMISIKLV